MPPFLQLVFAFPKLLQELLAMFIVQEEMYSFKFVFGPWQCCKLKTLVTCGWCLPSSKPCLALLVLTAKLRGSSEPSQGPPQVTDFLCSHSRDCSHLRALAVDTSREKGQPWIQLPKRHFPDQVQPFLVLLPLLIGEVVSKQNVGATGFRLLQ